MGDKKVNLELEWPTFQNNDDNRITYSPDSEAEDIFTNFKPATETHIRNKKRKPRKQKPKSLRLISGKLFLFQQRLTRNTRWYRCTVTKFHGG